jgi:hypothetical protein
VTDALNDSGKLAKRDSSPSQPSQITTVRKQQYGECGRKVTPTSRSLDDPPRLRRSDGVSVPMTSGADDASEDNRPSGLGTAATLEP